MAHIVEHLPVEALERRCRAAEDATEARHIVLVPDGITLVFLPPHSPELQPAERLWPLVDEPVANRHFAPLDDLDAVVAERCRLDPATVRPHTAFHGWPKPVQPI